MSTSLALHAGARIARDGHDPQAELHRELADEIGGEDQGARKDRNKHDLPGPVGIALALELFLQISGEFPSQVVHTQGDLGPVDQNALDVGDHAEKVSGRTFTGGQTYRRREFLGNVAVKPIC